MPAAYGYIGFVASHHDLFAMSYDLAVDDPGIELCPSSAPADRGNLLNVVGDFHKPLGAGKQMACKIGSQAIADNRKVIPVHNLRKKIHLLLSQKLRLVNKDAVKRLPCLRLFGESLIYHFIKKILNKNAVSIKSHS